MPRCFKIIATGYSTISGMVHAGILSVRVCYGCYLVSTRTNTVVLWSHFMLMSMDNMHLDNCYIGSGTHNWLVSPSSSCHACGIAAFRDQKLYHIQRHIMFGPVWRLFLRLNASLVWIKKACNFTLGCAILVSPFHLNLNWVLYKVLHWSIYLAMNGEIISV